MITSSFQLRKVNLERLSSFPILLGVGWGGGAGNVHCSLKYIETNLKIIFTLFKSNAKWTPASLNVFPPVLRGRAPRLVFSMCGEGV